jgi:hypothetical protein
VPTVLTSKVLNEQISPAQNTPQIKVQTGTTHHFGDLIEDPNRVRHRTPLEPIRVEENRCALVIQNPRTNLDHLPRSAQSVPDDSQALTVEGESPSLLIRVDHLPDCGKVVEIRVHASIPSSQA